MRRSPAVADDAHEPHPELTIAENASRTQPAPRSRVRIDSSELTVAALAAVGAVLATLLIHGIRLASAPDIFGDEGLYYLVAHNLATGAGLLDDTGHVFFWHPPLYPILVSGYVTLTGTAGLGVVPGLLASREVNVVLSALTAGALVLFGWRMAGLRAGLLMALLFILDPFVERVNRRAMLETLAMLLVLVGIAAFQVPDGVHSRRRIVVAGAAFGLALLTKEVAAIGLISIAVWAVVFEHRARKAAAAVAAISAAIYACFPLWAFAIGNGDRFLAFRFGALARVLRIGEAIVPTEARVAPSPSADAVTRVTAALADYGPSYLLLAAGALGTALLVVRYRHHPQARYLAAWSATSYLCIGAGIIGGFGDQFYYYVIIPAIVVVGAIVGGTWGARPSGRRAIGPWALRVASVLVALVLVANLGIWVTRYVAGRDDGYARLVPDVVATVPAGASILVSSDVPNFLLRPRYAIVFLRDQASIKRQGIEWFLLSSKDAAFGYNHMSPAFYAWIMDNTEPVAEVDGPTFRTLGLYRWTGPRAAAP
ncbi:MAG TPA: hypothetical protein VGK16_09935 [Candidatus Limnocylindrales bacterium]